VLSKGILAATSCLILLTCLYGRPQASEVVLARDYPYNSLFLAMAERTVHDYAVAYHAWPPDLQAAAAAGYMPYSLPAQTELEYSVKGSHANLSSGGRPVVFGDQVTDEPYDVTLSLPKPEPYSIVEGRQVAQVGSELVYSPGKEKIYHWDGAQWADDYSMPQILSALMLKRLSAHLAYASNEYMDVIGAPPVSFQELENFVGAERNPSAWQIVNVVNSLSEVDNHEGNLFAGWDEGKWYISCNLGLETYTYYLIQDGSGGWNSKPAVIMY
jgi:hypothetical protein